MAIVALAANTINALGTIYIPPIGSSIPSPDLVAYLCTWHSLVRSRGGRGLGSECQAHREPRQTMGNLAFLHITHPSIRPSIHPHLRDVRERSRSAPLCWWLAGDTKSASANPKNLTVTPHLMGLNL